MICNGIGVVDFISGVPKCAIVELYFVNVYARHTATATVLVHCNIYLFFCIHEQIVPAIINPYVLTLSLVNLVRKLQQCSDGIMYF